MGKAASRFRQTDLTKAIRAVDSAGFKIDRIEIDPISGKIIILPLNGAARAVDDSWSDF
ncbi:hypothetical protein SAMN06295912_108152 [Sphingomonas laterariae]|uniref:Uncharacterized protein n=1 Tax=Edaphosphingomonas laterariae TaxID=861865 RepID=A0A239FCG3_9SPHN|nr:hypothetical protein [Sphingomonas laterariae]SNS53993.1 hypothetical protein SAMN06295912_108152 [Sphingomonas laterariae]